MSTEGKCYLSPAKINLFLHILNRRADGYHELQTVFQLLDFGDELTFNGNENGILTFHQTAENQLQPLPASQNIIIKAAQLLRKRTNNVEKGAEIGLTAPANAALVEAVTRVETGKSKQSLDLVRSI